MYESWLIDLGGGKFGVTTANHTPKGAIVLTPLFNGKQVRKIEFLDVVNSVPILNTTKRDVYIASRRADLDDRRSVLDVAAVKSAELRALTNLTTLPEMRDALFKVMEVLGIK